jgi:hypothetical protein
VVVGEKPEAGSADGDPTVRVIAYANLIRCLHHEINREDNLAPIIIAYLRGLRSFPEYRDTTVLYLDNVDVTGSSTYDQLMKREIAALLDELLGTGAI